MTSVSHESSRIAPEKRSSALQLQFPEMWASLAIIVMWVTVLLDALFGPDIETHSGVGDIGENAVVPSAVALALFAFLATWVVARYGFRRDRKSG
jgi:hypothetical protein